MKLNVRRVGLIHISTPKVALYKLYFTDSSGKIISDISRIIADKANSSIQNRFFRCNFNLKPLEFSNTEIYYLIIADEDGFQISREEFQIDVASTTDNFGFFD